MGYFVTTVLNSLVGNTNIPCSSLQAPKYTFSRIGLKQQTNGGIGWSDEGIARYNEIYDRVLKADHLLQGNTFNKESLKVYRQRHQKKRKAPILVLTTTVQKGESHVTA
jgi:hypothetical protein